MWFLDPLDYWHWLLNGFDTDLTNLVDKVLQYMYFFNRCTSLNCLTINFYSKSTSWVKQFSVSFIFSTLFLHSFSVYWSSEIFELLSTKKQYINVHVILSDLEKKLVCLVCLYCLHIGIQSTFLITSSYRYETTFTCTFQN